MDLLSFCDDLNGGSGSLTSSATISMTRSAPSITETAFSTATTDPTETQPGSIQSEQPTSRPESPPDSDSGGLSTGAKAGIGVGAAIGVILLLLVAFLLGRRRRKDPEPTSTSHTGEDGKKELEMEGEKWVPELEGNKSQISELEGRKTQIPAELECPSSR